MGILFETHIGLRLIAKYVSCPGEGFTLSAGGGKGEYTSNNIERRPRKDDARGKRTVNY